MNGHEEPKGPKKLLLGHIISPTIMIVSGLLLGTITFLFEVGRRSYKNRRKHWLRQKEQKGWIKTKKSKVMT